MSGFYMCTDLIIPNRNCSAIHEHFTQLVRFKPNFVKDRVKELYSEIWGLDVSADGNTVFTAWNNSILVSDLGGS